MSETPIDQFHVYTHTDSFAIRVRNRQIRNVLNELADMAKDLQNIASADLEGGVYPLDRQVIDKHLEGQLKKSKLREALR